ncbi:vacuolar protein sorting-associated protein 54, chloroplastic-like [Chenopodium quinoa]|uniref:vacuolar protein sorting-associated protein 54, chloroplastic-like n=1 Tax=Chenopodium quinoa TaxID=63459 RepID=UPI000B78474A|nr:vacuolar protein sorting-associated protein 54, chloroplastic-like [Chenopodium quinoa]
MESRPSVSGRFNLEAATASTSSSSSSPSRENSISRTSSNSSLSSKAIFEHNLSSILNNPHSSDASSWLGWWSSPTSVILPEFAPINTSKPGLDANKSDFQPYLNSISEHYARFEDIRNHSSKENVDIVENIGGQGEALVACLREVPALYFKEDFELEDGGTFRAACPFSTMNENLVLQERLSQYLDVVEMHLVKEISLRSNSFFEAQQQLGDLNVKIVEGCKRIRELKETIRLLDADVVGSAREIQEFSSMRGNLLELQQKLRLILYVDQALGALKLLVASADCAGALDVADDLRQLLDGDELTGLHCFRHLRDHVAASMDSIYSILSAEFMRASLHDAGDLDAIIVSTAKERASVPSNGRLDDVKLDEEETSNFRDLVLPIVIGLLRTAKLPSVLRMYRDTLTADMKTAIKNAVAELLPVLIARSQESDFSAGEKTGDADCGGSSLASRLRSLSSESFVELLAAVFKIVLAHLVRAAEVKKSIEWIMSNLDGHYASESVAAAIAHGAAASEAAQDDNDNQNQVNHAIAYSSQRNATKAPSLQGKATELTSTSNVSKNFRADVLRENAEAVFAACDAAHGRWAKLLGVRALLHPKLRLPEFLSIYSITQDFINATEKIGGRLGYSIRGTLQSQAKAFVDFQHESRVSKIKAVLDQETWSEVDVPDEFQAIVASMHGSDSLITENFGDDQGSSIISSNGVSTVVDGSKESDVEQHIERTDSNNVSGDVSNQEKSQHLGEANDASKADAGTSALSKNSNTKDRGKSTSQTLMYRGVGYHMVNCGLILLKMLSEYIDMNDSLPSLSSEIVHRVVEILKFFNTRTCQLVLGAGAMQVSGLKSITSKHLALASQVISFTYAIIPDIKQVLFLNVPETRKPMLKSEIDRVAQDYKVHRDEIHTKLVQIMRERLLVHLRGLPHIVESWNKPDDGDTQPSQFAKSLTKEVGYLQRVLSRMLHEADVQAIFRQVVIIFHSQISEAFSRLEISTPQAKSRLYRDVQHILGCIRSLPTDIASKSGVANWGHLDEFLAQRFDSEGDQ